MNGIELIAKERQRQITDEGWTAQHDDQHESGLLTRAAIAYALAGVFPEGTPGARTHLERAKLYYWPWSLEWWKPKDRMSNLVRAGALIAAEIDRLQRLSK